MEDSAAGPREDFDPKDTCSTRLNIIVWFLCGLAAVFVCLRLYCKSINKRSLWWDDYVLIGSWVRCHPLLYVFSVQTLILSRSSSQPTPF